MAGLAQLKKRLRSIELSGQLAGALKTVSSAKYARLSHGFAAERVRSDKLERLAALCGGNDEREFVSEDARDCVVVIGHGKGFCGGYNAELHAFAETVLQRHPGAYTLVCGKKAIAYFEDKRLPVCERFLLPELPAMEVCRPLIERAAELYDEGKVLSVRLVYQSFVNSLTQTPVERVVLPLAPAQESGGGEDVLWIPDRATVARGLRRKIYEAQFFRAILEGALSAQASTLNAMRTAYDNALDASEKLRIQINKTRQSAVTAGVLEVSSGAAMDQEDENGGWK